MPLRVALVGGPMYDHFEAVFAPGEVEVIVRADHPTLNRTVAEMLRAGERIDVLATHSKYAPSQVQWLTPLDDIINTNALAPAAVELCKYRGQQWCVPRLIDVRLLWTRSDRIEMPSASWDELMQSNAVFGFTGRESGAFGMFFELVVGAGGQLFTSDLAPMMNSDVAVEALAIMKALADRAPSDLPSWHYDQVDRALLNGDVDVAAAWPGGWSAISRSSLPLVPSLYPRGRQRSVSYSGCHAWAIPRTCGDIAGATELVDRLVGLDAQLLDASGGSICAHMDAFERVQPKNAIDEQRLTLTRYTIAHMMITYPPLPTFPAIETGGADAITRLLLDELSPSAAAELMQSVATSSLSKA